MVERDWRELYNLEAYLFSTVRSRFQSDGVLSTFDFFCIVIWKANRAKSKVARLLLKQVDSLEAAVATLTADLVRQGSSKERMRVLVEDWGFRLPMASAVLSVLFPDEFTVYDTRVCEMIGGFGSLAERRGFEKLWEGYLQFKAEVEAAAPQGFSLREKDRYLWAKSFGLGLARDIARGFRSEKRSDSGQRT